MKKNLGFDVRGNTTRWKGGMVVLGNREKVVRGLKKRNPH
jgi:hypothetical protein